MSKLLLTIIFSLLLLFSVTSFADEEDMAPLMVPHDAVSQEQPQDEADVAEEASLQKEVVQYEETPQKTEALSEPISEKVVQEEHSEGETTNQPMQGQVQEQQEVEAPSTEEQEAKHAEEAELREVGAGEEPTEE